MEKTVEIAKEVLSLIYPVMQQLKVEHSEFVGVVISKHIEKTSAHLPWDNKAQSAGGTTLSLSLDYKEPAPDVDEVINRIQKKRARSR
jgi:hypothetical protein